jgi:methionine synthase II (cobalamin-independent)
MMRKTGNPELEPFVATGIGSLPFLSPEEACREILSHPSLIPFWPQLVQKDPREDMGLQYSPPLPCLKADLLQKILVSDPDCNRSESLTFFYEKFLSRDLSFFSLRPEFASGFYQMMKMLSEIKPPGAFVKGHVVGPITLGLSTKVSSDRYLIHDADLMDAAIKGLAMEAVDQAKKLATLNRSAILFLDEPSLSGYGSAFTPLSRKEVLDILGEIIQLIREQTEALIGLHCCGNTDWSLLLSLDIDILNFDAYGFGDSLLLYPQEIKAFLDKGKILAWGIVPTADYTGSEKAQDLMERLTSLLKNLAGQGLDQDRLYAQAMITPACGMGTLPENTARKLLALLSETSLMAREKFRR